MAPRTTSPSAKTRPQAPARASARPSPALVIAEGAGEATGQAVRAAPSSPIGAAFGAAEHLIGAGRRALGAARTTPISPAAPPEPVGKRGRSRATSAIARSISHADPALVIER